MEPLNNTKFAHNRQFDAQFDQVPELRWYPYVGKNFGRNGARIMVYAHNAPVKPAEYEQTRARWSANKADWANAMEEYTYERRDYTKAFRYFIKGAVGLDFNYGDDSEASVIDKIDSFVHSIAYINFIQDAVKSESQIARAERHQVEISIRVNREILRILDITHCICWGKPTYEYVTCMPGFKVLSEDTNLGKSGFSSCVIDVGNGKLMRCLRIYHPSMPSFGAHSTVTHSIISGFLTTKVEGKQVQCPASEGCHRMVMPPTLTANSTSIPPAPNATSSRISPQ